MKPVWVIKSSAPCSNFVLQLYSNYCSAAKNMCPDYWFLSKYPQQGDIMWSWILVFYIGYPNNYTVHQKFQSERECMDAEQLWNRRLTMVKSDIKAECRRNDINPAQ